MTNYNIMSDVFGAVAMQVPAHGPVTRGIAYNRFSFADLATAAVQNDVLYIGVIPAKSRIHSVDAVLVTAEGDAATIHIGDYSDLVGSAVDADGWLKGFSINGAVGSGAGTGGNTEAYGAAGGKFYASAAYLAITCPDNFSLAVAVVDIYVDFSKYYDEEGD